jgi:hypothetical protein
MVRHHRRCSRRQRNGSGDSGRINRTCCDIYEDMIHHAAVTVCEAGYGSSFVIGKKLGIGYNRSRMLIEALQEAGILGEFDLETRRFPLIRPIGFY